ncbi:myofilin isoform X1 [Rhodnius prolixus]|uniref:myofilin isoform X1 n=1 Tax=Rhodnius prolixus TaxID=13249 RepID=UPI003D18E302
MLLHNHLDMIGRNEPIQRKAKFWQSYVRALKGPKYPLTDRTHMFAFSRDHSIGTDDIRAPDATHYSRYPTSRGIFRPLLDFPSWPHVKSIFDDPVHPSDRISVPGYRYLPISRETYGLTPRNIYPHHYSSIDRYPRLADHDYSTRVGGEFKHDEHGHFQFQYFVPWSDWDPVEGRQAAQKHLNPAYRRLGTKPFVKEYTVGPDGAKVPLYTYTDLLKEPVKSVFIKDYVPPYSSPIYSRGGITKRPMVDLFEPKNWIPLSRYTRDPWWWQYPQYKPFEAPYVPMKHSPFYLRDSYLSPVKNTYLWRDHPIRPFSTTPRLVY